MSQNRLGHLGSVAVLGSLALLAAGCSASTSSSPGESEPKAGGEMTVFAASSLTAPFTEIGRQFESAHPGTKVRFNFAGSADLVSQLQQGADADVFASADTANMDRAVGDSLVAGSPQDFATNTMAIAVPPDNPAGVTRFADLTDSATQVVVCAPQVPCGAATERVEQSTGVTLTPVSEESAVADVLNKVITGEADAGVVYVTDVATAGDKVLGVPIPVRDNAVSTYPIAVLAASADSTVAQEFEALVLGPTGQRILADAGFGAP